MRSPLVRRGAYMLVALALVLSVAAGVAGAGDERPGFFNEFRDPTGRSIVLPEEIPFYNSNGEVSGFVPIDELELPPPYPLDSSADSQSEEIAVIECGVGAHAARSECVTPD